MRPVDVLARHFRRYFRCYVAALAGGAVWLATREFDASQRMLLAADAFFATHMVTTGLLSRRSRHESFRERLQRDDEGIVVITLIGAVIVLVALTRVFALLQRADRPAATLFVLSLTSVPLGWAMFHSMFGFHYANVYYSALPQGERTGGLSFPGEGDPHAWDFLYFAFVIAMTSQVSDVQVVSTRMRRITLIHGMISFFFNTVILAIAVNVSLGPIGR